jgi:hypothetical protein
VIVPQSNVSSKPACSEKKTLGRPQTAGPSSARVFVHLLHIDGIGLGLWTSVDYMEHLWSIALSTAYRHRKSTQVVHHATILPETPPIAVWIDKQSDTDQNSQHLRRHDLQWAGLSTLRQSHENVNGSINVKPGDKIRAQVSVPL